MGGVCPNASENGQISPSITVRAARGDGSCPNCASALQGARETANIQAGSGVIWRIPDNRFASIMAGDGLTIDRIDCTELGLKPPLVSVVITSWNHARFVGAAIDSIRGQDYPHLECLVIDNGSIDDSRAV